ncbi:MAG: helix-turn-helix domain-containing protein [Candidatus Diapherotrites archaeon]
MWVLKLKFWHQNSFAIPYAKKYNLTILGFPLHKYVTGDFAHITTGHLLLGREKDKQAYLADVRKNPKVEYMETEGNFLIYSGKVPKNEFHTHMYFSPEIFFVKPLTIKPDGFEYLEVASIEKKYLSKFLKKIEKSVKINSVNLSKEKMTDFYIPHLIPKLTEKQKEAITIAYAKGFYEFPKKTNIERLAKSAKLSPSTFQEHLRKAEEKLLPFILESLAIK